MFGGGAKLPYRWKVARFDGTCIYIYIHLLSKKDILSAFKMVYNINKETLVFKYL